MNDKNYLSRIFLGILLFSIIYACYLVFKPFLGEFLIATILVTIFYKPFEYILGKLKGRKMLASFTMCLLIFLLIVIPLTNLFIFLDVKSSYADFVYYLNHEGLEDVRFKLVNSPFIDNLGIFGINKDIIGLYMDDLDNLYKIFKDWALSNTGGQMIVNTASSIITNSLSFIFSLLIIFLSMFFFFADGKQMSQKLMYWTPLPNKYDKRLFHKFKEVSYATIISTFITAICQGLIGALGFFIISFPIFFPAVLMAIASIIPYIGTALIWLPIGLYLLFIGNIWQGIFIIIWGAVLVGNSDNIIRAYLIKDKAGAHPLFVFFSIIGGLSLFGFWGIVYGPLIISLAVTILHIYEIEYKDLLEE